MSPEGAKENSPRRKPSGAQSESTLAPCRGRKNSIYDNPVYGPLCLQYAGSRLMHVALGLRLIAALLASFTLLLTMVILGETAPQGLPVYLPSRHAVPTPYSDCYWPQVIVSIQRHRKLLLNSKPIDEAALAPRLKEIFGRQVERAGFVTAAPAVSFGELVEVIAIMKPIAFNIGLLTPSSVPTSDEPLLVECPPNHWPPPPPPTRPVRPGLR
jgi:biopolymer transport protein ExbD